MKARFKPRGRLWWAALALLLAACEGSLLPVDTPTPTWALTGPTLQPSPTILPLRATEVPEEYIGVNNPTAAALPPGGALPPLPVPGVRPEGDRIQVEVTALDGMLLRGDLYQSSAVRLPGVLLLAPDVAGWGAFPLKLHNAGFTVLVMAVRQGTALADFQVMLQALMNGEVDPARLGVVGAESGADVALLGCAGDLLCDAAALLSPSDSPALRDALIAFNPRPLFLTASQSDSASFGAVQALQAASSAAFFQPFADAGRGAALLTNRPDLGDLLIAWLEQNLV
jgi:hypothetical protein